MRIADLAVVPGREHPLGVLDHHRGISFDLLVLECRLGQPALPAPEVALARQESLAHQRDQPPRQLVLHEVVRVGAQDVLDLLGVADQVSTQGSPASATRYRRTPASPAATNPIGSRR